MQPRSLPDEGGTAPEAPRAGESETADGGALGPGPARRHPLALLRAARDRLLAPFVVPSASGRTWAYLDGVRGVAVLLVVAFHCWVLSGGALVAIAIPGSGREVSLVPYLARGFIGVDLFFVLSGFLLSQPWFRADYLGRPAPRLEPYVRSRVLRIVPAYYACLFVMLVFLTPALIPTALVWSALGVKTLLAHLAFAQYLFPITSADYGINGSLWTLTMEAIFYLVLPGAVGLFRRNRWLLALPVAVGVNLGWLALARHSLGPLVDYLQGTVARFGVDHATIRYFLSKQFPAHLTDFALGITLANLAVRRSSGWRVTGRFGTLTGPAAGLGWFLAGSAGLVLLLQRLDRYPTLAYYLAEIGFGFCFTLALAGLVFGGERLRAPFECTPLRLVGLCGYSAYLWHMPLIYLVLKYPEVSALEPSARFAAVTARVLPLLSAVSIFFFLVIEKPFLLLGRRSAAILREAP